MARATKPHLYLTHGRAVLAALQQAFQLLAVPFFQIRKLHRALGALLFEHANDEEDKGRNQQRQWQRKTAKIQLGHNSSDAQQGGQAVEKKEHAG